MRRTRTLALVAALVVSAVAAGCGSSTQPAERADDPAAETTVMPSTSSTPTTAPPQSDEEAVLAAVQGYWNVVTAANDPPDPTSPELDRYMTGEAKELTVSNLTKHQQLGIAIRAAQPSQFASQMEIVSIGSDTAVVSNCVLDDSQQVDIASGRVLNDKVETLQFTMSLVRLDDGWKVTKNVTEQRWDGKSGCALAP